MMLVKKQKNLYIDDSNFDMNNAVLISDAFFPFKDNIEIAHKFNIKNILSVKGSIRDQEIITEAKKSNINLFFTEKRHFKH